MMYKSFSHHTSTDVYDTRLRKGLCRTSRILNPGNDPNLAICCRRIARSKHSKSLTAEKISKVRPLRMARSRSRRVSDATITRSQHVTTQIVKDVARFPRKSYRPNLSDSEIMCRSLFPFANVIEFSPVSFNKGVHICCDSSSNAVRF